MPYPPRILLSTGATAAVLLAWACLAGGDPAAAGAAEPAVVTQQATDTAPTVTKLPAHVVAIGDRSLHQQQPWSAKCVLPFPLAADRAGARAASLEQRAALRSFEGAPPVMPHSTSFGAGSKACVDCHTDGMTLGERVAHPMSHPPLSSCTQCHIESTNRELPPPRTIASTFAGARPDASATPTTGAPPTMPHGVHMRSRCLSCHGEFGYPGLRTSHPQRALCVQCHIEEAPSR